MGPRRGHNTCTALDCTISFSSSSPESLAILIEERHDVGGISSAAFQTFLPWRPIEKGSDGRRREPPTLRDGRERKGRQLVDCGKGSVSTIDGIQGFYSTEINMR